MNIQVRDSYFDNLKGLLILGVVTGHILEPFLTEPPFKYLYLVIYAFHMPLFIFCSGYFTHRQTGETILKRMVWPYILFQTFYGLYFLLLGEKNFTFGYTTPCWLMWYLFALIFWNLAVPHFSVKKRNAAVAFLLLSGAVGILAGFIPIANYFFSISRIIVFFPFFLGGYYMRSLHLSMDLFKKRGILIPAVLLSMGILILLCLYLPQINHKWFYGARPYNQQDSSFGIRLFIYLAALPLSAVVCGLTPVRSHFFITNAGRYCLPVYLLHGFLVRPLWHLPKVLAVNPALSPILIAASVMLALVLTGFLSSPVLYRRLSFLFRFPR